MPKIALVDDHKMFRDGLVAILKRQDNVTIVFECQNGQELLDRITNDIDIVIMDLDMPKLNGIQCMERLQAEFPLCKVIILSQSKDPSLICQLMEFGARGYIHKMDDSETLVHAIQSVDATGYYFNDLVSATLLKKLAMGTQIDPLFDIKSQLSKRETQVIELICQAKTTNEIANELFLSPKTVNNHRARILDKTGTGNTAGLVVFAIKNNIVSV